jgi:hypothetical protein
VASAISLLLPAALTMAYSRAACIPLAEGWLASGVTPQLTEDGVVIPSQSLVPSSWMSDSSAKWLKLHAKYQPGKVYKVWNGTVGTASAATSLPSDITLVPYLTDSSDNEYTPTGETTTTIENGSVCKVVYKTGTMHKAAVTDWLTYHIWIKYYADRIDVEHSFVVTGSASTVKPIKTLGITCTPPASWQPFLRDAPNRAPFALSGNNIILWASGGYSSVAIAEATFHTRPWEYSGEFLLLMPPAGAATYATTYAGLYPTEGEEDSSQVEGNITDYDPRGRSISCMFSFFSDSYANGVYRTMCQRDPVPMPSPAEMCDTGAFGPAKPRSTTYATFENSVEQYWLNWNSQTKAGNIHRHWNTWGNLPEKITNGRANLKRGTSVGHYPQHPLAILYLRGAGQSVLDCFRQASQFIRDHLQCDFAGAHAYKVQWGFSHGKCFHPDGTSGPSAASGDTDFSLTGHWPDPALLLFRWLIDHNYHAKQGFDNWLSAVDFSEDAFGREAVGTLMQAVHAWRYKGRDFPAARYTEMYSAAAALITRNLDSLIADGDIIGKFYSPVWIDMAIEVLQNSASQSYLLENARQMSLLALPYVPYHVEGYSTLAVMAQAVANGGSTALLDDVFPPVSPVAPSSGYEQGPASFGELYQSLAWPIAQYYLGLDEQGVSNVALSPVEKQIMQQPFPSRAVGQVLTDNIDKIDDAPTLTKAILGSAAGLKVDAGEVTLDGSNPTPVTVTGMTSISSVQLTIKSAAALGVDPTTVTYNTSGTTLNIYAWKVTGTGDTTLIASTNSEIVIGWVAYGT